MSETVYDIVRGVELGLSSATKTTIKNVMSFADKKEGRDGDMVEPITVINYADPRNAHQNQKLINMELVLDSFNHQAFYNQRTLSSDANSRAIRQGRANDPIGWFAVYLREDDGTDKRWVYESEKTWVTHLVHDYSNEPQTRNKPTTISLQCLGNKTVSDVPFSGNDTTAHAHLRTDTVTTPLGSVSNILSVREEYLMGNDPRFVPNVYHGVGMKFNQEWRNLTLVFDSDVSIFDSYIDMKGVNAPLPSFRINHTMLEIHSEDEVQESWIYPSNKVYVVARNEGRISEGSERKTFEYRLLAYGTKTTTFS